MNELKRQVEHVKLDRDKQLEAARTELEQAQERIMHLQRSESLIEVYKKKIENFEHLRRELADMQDHNQKLYGDIEVLEKEKQANLKLEELVQQLTIECAKGKDSVMFADLRIQELQFKLEDLNDKIKQFEKKDAYQRNQIEQLQTEFARTSTEFMVMKQDGMSHMDSAAK